MVNLWLRRITILYGFWFIGGYILVTGNILPTWLEWSNSFYLILGGVTALVWYVNRYGGRQALILFVVCGSISYTAEWIGVHTGRWFGVYDYGPSFAPLVLGVPLAIPFVWCMLLVISKAYAPIRNSQRAWRGFRLSEKLSLDRYRIQRERRRIRRHSFWLPAIWAATMMTAIDLLLDPVAVQKRYLTWNTAENAAWNPSPYSVPISNYISWWITALLIINIINYLHDEYLEKDYAPHSSLSFIPMILLLTLEFLFLTLAIKSGLWWAVAANILTLAVLFLWKRKEEAR
ncbi:MULTISPECIES: carotenoid biosynthesis protein [unclassified Paenibacillus]|uniref:carotenoid biosynthesis protein n=1 Tax=unclassified Paenibacillus TaxID=185978 RepID=UPI001AE3623D|nr:MULTISPECIES: carotenoid biosynthesis protein [unclassified Paenibacillus]MBP1155476.1 putative membrane protein [Paenibacillus sp. PvP091]MBP1169138.1 putative membrane protein [Paenibacillus sp. PvR098]MBP2440166.1 putative membrane protein [Paenibacillus sp. PvP052]